MGSSFPHAVQHANSRIFSGTSSLQQQRRVVNKLSENALLCSNVGNFLKGQKSSCQLLSSKLTGRTLQGNLQGSLNLRCCEAGAAEADILVPEGGAALGAPFEQVDYNTARPYRDSPTVSRPFTGSEVSIAEENTLRRYVDIPAKKVDESAGPLANKEESLHFIDGNEDKNLLQQMWDIVVFAGPALGIWLSGPLMSLIDTAVVGKNSSLELAALGPGTVFCDQFGYVFMFLSVATSNLIATSLAKQDEARAAHHLSRLLFVALVAGIGMFLLTGAFAEPFPNKFVGPENVGLVSAAFSYVKNLPPYAPYVSHRGRTATLSALECFFYWPTLRRDTHNYIEQCLVCQKSKFDRQKTLGLVQPLPVPDAPWEAITMDFIT